MCVNKVPVFVPVCLRATMVESKSTLHPHEGHWDRATVIAVKNRLRRTSKKHTVSTFGELFDWLAVDENKRGLANAIWYHCAIMLEKIGRSLVIYHKSGSMLKHKVICEKAGYTDAKEKEQLEALSNGQLYKAMSDSKNMLRQHSLSPPNSNCVRRYLPFWLELSIQMNENDPNSSIKRSVVFTAAELYSRLEEVEKDITHPGEIATVKQCRSILERKWAVSVPIQKRVTPGIQIEEEEDDEEDTVGPLSPVVEEEEDASTRTRDDNDAKQTA